MIALCVSFCVGRANGLLPYSIMYLREREKVREEAEREGESRAGISACVRVLLERVLREQSDAPHVNLRVITLQLAAIATDQLGR